ncbi:NADPH-dependent FMN reductase OS=Streptomyces microflavus OX=1919 GN=ssuE PE=4 SV=1 [Streptomyces microflavus]
MATVLSVSGSPSATSRTARLLLHLDDRLRDQGHDVVSLDVRTLPADALLGADFGHPAIVEATALFERVDGVVIGTPIYKAAYWGSSSRCSTCSRSTRWQARPSCRSPGRQRGPCPRHRLRVAPGADLDGRSPCSPGWFTLDKDITVGGDGTVSLAAGTAEALGEVTDRFSSVLRERTAVLAPSA